MIRPLLLALALVCAEAARADADWAESLGRLVERVDRESPGRLGVYVKRLDNGEAFAYGADRRWYLASAAKLPIAIAMLQEVEAGRHALEERVVLQAGDKVDGSGRLVWQKEGSAYRVDALLERMLMESDNTAANLLVRTMGEETLNRRARSFLGEQGVGRLTSFTEVRYNVYAELHPDARTLSNEDLVTLAGAPLGPRRVERFRRMLSLGARDLRARTVDEAYERYYAKGLNAATLEAYGGMLERLVRGRLLSEPLTKRLFRDMKYDTYDAYRLEAGLPRSVRFIHKTGTQWRRACHMGVIEPQEGGRRAIVVAACAEALDEQREAGRVFERIGRAISQVLLKG